jgi:hypothetical protein
VFKHFKAFWVESLNDYLREEDSRIRNVIKNESREDYILNVNETEYINYIFEENKLDFPILNFEDISMEHYKKDIRGEMPLTDYYMGGAYSRLVIRYMIPFTGNIVLLKYRPNPYQMNTVEVYTKDNCLCFEVINFEDDPTKIKGDFEGKIKFLKEGLKNSQKQVNEHNNNLKMVIEQSFKAKKARILKDREILASLDVPFKKREDLSGTYSIPTPNFRKQITIEPEVTEEDYNPEPTLNEQVYFEIIKTINDLGKVFERSPESYKDLKENDLRNIILSFLEAGFEGSATGETFNKYGKTDILLRYENLNAFIGECKFWKGKESYLNTISQLLKYLTWRDSKAAVIMFVNNKDISPVLENIKTVTPTHPNYLGFVDEKSESWFNYRFHINDDKNREVKLAVLLFHIPK